MMRSLYSGVSGLKTHQTKMDVIGNNIANVNTVAYKSSSVSFSELMYQTTSAASRANAETGRGGINAKQIGLGVTMGATNVSITTTGATQTTGNPFDLKITGDSFFIVSDGVSNYFTRAGAFYVDSVGNLCMTSSGYNVMGWQVDENTGEILQNTVSPLKVMADKNLYSQPEATELATASGVLDKSDPNLVNEGGKIMSLTVYDDLGYEYTAKFSVKPVTTAKTAEKNVTTVSTTYEIPAEIKETEATAYNYKLSTDEGGWADIKKTPVPTTFEEKLTNFVKDNNIANESRITIVKTEAEAAGDSTKIWFKDLDIGAGSDLIGRTIEVNLETGTSYGVGDSSLAVDKKVLDTLVDEGIYVKQDDFRYGIVKDGKTVASSTDIENAKDELTKLLTGADGSALIPNGAKITISDTPGSTNLPSGSPLTVYAGDLNLPFTSDFKTEVRITDDGTGTFTYSPAKDLLPANLVTYLEANEAKFASTDGNPRTVTITPTDIEGSTTDLDNIPADGNVTLYTGDAGFDLKSNLDGATINFTLAKKYTRVGEESRVQRIEESYEDGTASKVSYGTSTNNLDFKPLEEDRFSSAAMAALLSAGKATDVSNVVSTKIVTTTSAIEGQYTVALTELIDVANDKSAIDFSILGDTANTSVVFSTNDGRFSYVGEEGQNAFDLRLSMLGGNFKDVAIDFSTVKNVSNDGTSTVGIKAGDEDGRGAGKLLGALKGLSIDSNGKIYGSYSNGNTELLGQIAVTEFANASGLEKVGENLYQTTLNSGEFDGVGRDITAIGGSMSSGVLEMSNVDLSSEFTEMITTQRGFQANSRIITTSDTLLEELINLKR